MKPHLLLPLLLLLSAPALRAGTPSYALPTAVIPRDPAHACAGYASLTSGAWAAFGNVAAVPFSPAKAGVGLGWQHWMPEVLPEEHFLAGATLRLGEKAGLTLGGAYQRAKAYPVFDDGGTQTGSFTPGDLILQIGGSYRVTDWLGLGCKLGYLRSSLAEDFALNGFTADLSALVAVGDWHFAAALAQLGPRVRSGGEGYPLPSSARLGANWGRSFGAHHLEADADADFFLHGGVSAGIGLDYTLLEHYSLRLGFRYGSDKAVLPSFFSLGAGVQWAGWRLDLVWLAGNDSLKNSLAIGLSKAF